EQQMRMGGAEAAKRALALSRSGTGSAGAAAQRASQAQSDISLETNAQAAQLRAAEQQRAEEAYMGGMQGIRGQDLQNMGLDQQTILANLQSEQGQRAMNDQMTQFYMNQGLARDV